MAWKLPTRTVGLRFALLVAIQAAVCLVVHQRHLSGLFVAGALPGSPTFSRESEEWPVPIVVREDSTGYDGQFVLALALDPLMQTDLRSQLDSPSYRGHRIAWSAAAHFAGFGVPRLVIVMLFVLQALVAVGASTVFPERFALPAWRVSPALLFLTSLGSVVCLSRMTGDLVMVSLLLLAVHLGSREGFLSSLSAAGVMSLCVLQKETALVALPALALWNLAESRFAITVKLALPLAAFAGWWGWIATRTTPSFGKFAAINLTLPGVGWLEAVSRVVGDDGSFVHKAKELTLLSMFAVLIAFGVARGWKALRLWFATRRAPAADLALLGLALLAILQSEAVWHEVWAYSRALLPLTSLLLYSETTRFEGRTRETQIGSRWTRRFLVLQSVAGVGFLVSNLVTRTP